MARPHPGLRRLREWPWLRAVAAAATLLASAGTGRGQQFYSELQFGTPTFPRAVAAGDLDSDGHADLVVVRGGGFVGAGMCSVYFSDGSGGLLPPVTVPPGGATYDVAIGDVTGDGFPDLVRAIFTPPGISILPGDGAGGFGSPSFHAIPIAMPLLFTLSVELADVNGDGQLDVLTANAQNGGTGNQTLSLFLADGAGNLLPPVEAAPGFVASDQDLAVGRFDADGNLDIVSTGALLPGDGAGGFGPAVPLGLPAAVGIAGGDLNGDGAFDVVEVNGATSNNLRVVLSDGAGGFAGPVTYSAGTRPVQVEVADIDGDGRLDVLTADQGMPAGSVTILHGDGLGGLGSPTTLLSGGTGSTTQDLALCDIDLNGHLDIAAVNYGTATLSVHMQTDGSFALAAPLTAGTVTAGSAVALGDLDGDGDLDAVMSRSSSAGTQTQLVRWLGDGTGALSSPVAYTVFAPQEDVAIGFVNRDNRLDVVASLALLDAVVVLRGDGAGGLQPATMYPVGDHPDALELGDVDGDGSLDVVTANEQSHDVSVLLGDGLGALGPPDDHFVGGLEPVDVALAHLDLDGSLDLATADRSTQDLSVLLGDGTGGFVAPSPLAVSAPPEGLSIGDLDGDGLFDLVSGNSPSPGTISVLLGAGGGSFDPELLLPAYTSVTDVVLGDLNGDGRPDVVTVHGFSSRVTVRLGLGDGSLSPPLILSIANASGVALGDMNGDQRLDLVVSQRSGNGAQSIAVLLNQSQPHVWHDLGHGLAGMLGVPSLVGVGTLLGGSPGSLKLSHARPGAPAALFISPSSAPANFKGGTLVPVPPLVTVMAGTDAQGDVSLAWTSWPASPPGSSWFFQYGIGDSAAPFGVSLSNALRAVQP